MNEDILDNDLGVYENKKRTNLKNWISIILLWIGIGVCIRNGVYGDIKVISGIFLLAFCTFFTHANYNIGVKATFFLILLGTLNILNFFPFTILFSFGISEFDLGFEFVMFGILIIHVFSNKEIMSKFIGNRIIPEMTNEEIKAEFRATVNGFKRQFAKNSIEDLKNIVKNDRIVAEAKLAAEELLKEKEKNRI